jgi:hypothetical protein
MLKIICAAFEQILLYMLIPKYENYMKYAVIRCGGKCLLSWIIIALSLCDFKNMYDNDEIFTF